MASVSARVSESECKGGSECKRDADRVVVHVVYCLVDIIACCFVGLLLHL